MLDRPNLYSDMALSKIYNSAGSGRSRPRLISISEAYRNLAQLISQRDVPLKLSLTKDREVVSTILSCLTNTFRGEFSSLRISKHVDGAAKPFTFLLFFMPDDNTLTVISLMKSCSEWFKKCHFLMSYQHPFGLNLVPQNFRKFVDGAT